MSDDLIKATGFALAALRSAEESGVIVSFGAHGPSADCPAGYVSATVRNGPDEATSDALYLNDALRMARFKVAAVKTARLAKEKREADK